MLLKELFLSIPEDYAFRPVHGDDKKPTNLPTFDPMYAKVVGTQDGKDVWGSREKKAVEIYGFKDDNEVLAYLCLSEESTTSGAYDLRELWVSPKHRNQGLGSALILFLVQKLGLQLCLAKDEIVSDDARQVLWKLAERGKINVFKNEKWLSSSELEAEFNDKSKNDSELVIKEMKRNVPLFGSKLILEDGRTTLCEPCQVLQDSNFN